RGSRAEMPSPVARNRPSGEMAMASTLSLCQKGADPRRATASFDRGGSAGRGGGSGFLSPAEAQAGRTSRQKSKSRRGENMIPSPGSESIQGGQVPQLEGAVIVNHGQLLAVRRELHGHPQRRRSEGAQRSPRRSVVDA